VTLRNSTSASAGGGVLEGMVLESKLRQGAHPGGKPAIIGETL
jgi:hypothetical protein